jgi:GTP cyclohydrolase I
LAISAEGVTVAGEPDNVVELNRALWAELPEREIAPEDWLRFRGAIGEIFAAFGMDLDTPGTRETPERFLRALYDATAGYEGDPKLLTAFPA